MKIAIRLLTASSVCMLAACGSGSGQPLTDAGIAGDGGMSSDAAALDAAYDAGVASPIPGGGAGGGPINGHVIVFVLDRQTHNPIAEAVVQVDATPNPLTAMTNAEGRADIGSPSLTGAINVHVFASAYPYQTTLNINAMILTFELEKATSSASMLGTISGTIGGWSVLPTPTSTTTFQFGSVTAINKRLFDASNTIQQDLRTGQLVPTNVAIHNLYDDYSIKVDPNATAGLAVIGGLLTLRPRGQPPLARTTHIGILAPIGVNANMVLSGQNIDFSHALDQTISIMLMGAPDLPRKQIIAEVALPNGAGYAPIALAAASRTGTASVMAPALTGSLNGGQYVSAAIVQDNGNQTSIAVARSAQSGPITIDGFLSPPQGISATRRTISATPVTNATVHSFTIAKSAGLAWTINAVNLTRLMITLPEVPSGFVDPVTGTAVLTVGATRLVDIDLNNSSANDYLEHATAIASNSAMVNFNAQ
jgi:hypothetical protein